MEVFSSIHPTIININSAAISFVNTLPDQIVIAATSITATTVAKVALAILVVGYGIYKLNNYLTILAAQNKTFSNINQAHNNVVNCWSETHNAALTICKSLANNPQQIIDKPATETVVAVKDYLRTIPKAVIASNHYNTARTDLESAVIGANGPLNAKQIANLIQLDELVRNVLGAISIHEKINSCVEDAIAKADEKDAVLINKIALKTILNKQDELIAAIEKVPDEEIRG